MIGAKLRQPPACPSHPHRIAEERCDRCYVHFCYECVEDVDERLLCARCSDEVAALARIREESRLTPRNVLRRIARKSVLIGVLVVALILLGVGALVTVFWRSAGSEVDFTLIRRIRAGFTQTFELAGEGFDFAEQLNEGRLRASSQSPDPLHNAERINDGLPDPQVPAWHSASADLPVDLLFISDKPRLMGKIVLWNHPAEDPSTYIKEFEVFVSPVDPAKDNSQLESVGVFVAEQITDVQRFEFDPPVPTLFTLIRVNSHYGSLDYLSAAEIGLFLPNNPVDGPVLPQPFPVNRALRGQVG